MSPRATASATGRAARGPEGKAAGGCGCGGGCGGTCGCGCSACHLLTTATRPRYFAGQLLCEDDLRSEQDYVLAKNRLHNRYLHGWGVVWGLEIGCGECPGQVAVRPGYALDPCGNDVVVPSVQQFDVLKAIRACRDAARRKRADCDPYQQPENDACDDATEHWCITLRYEEQQRRPTTALRQQTSSAFGGCGGHGSGSCVGSCGGKCGCGGGNGGSANGNGYANGNGGNGAGCGCGTRVSTPAQTLGACEPTRVAEGFRLGVVQQCGDEPCAMPVEALRQTFLGRVVTCIQVVGATLGKRMNAAERAIVMSQLFLTGAAAGAESAQVVYTALCRYRLAVREVLEDQRLPKRCDRLATFDKIEVPIPDGEEPADSYAERSQPAFAAVTATLAEHIKDCICDALMPPGPTDPCDDRTILGCVEVRDDDVLEVCGWSGRRYAGSFPARAYWFSVGPAVAWAICRFCCDPFPVRGRRGRYRLMSMLDSVDPSGSLRRSVAADDFFLPQGYLAEARRFVTLAQPRNWARFADRLPRPKHRGPQR